MIGLSEREHLKKIRITSTVPIPCTGISCDLSSGLTVEIGQTNADSFVNTCYLNFEPGPGNQIKELELIAKRDFRDDGDQTMDLKVHVPIDINLIDWIDHKSITNIRVSKNL